MSKLSETSRHPPAPTIKQEQQQQGNTTIDFPSPPATKQFQSAQSPNDGSKAPPPPNPRRHPGTIMKTPSRPHPGASRPNQRSSTSPNTIMSQAQPVHYTRTGRISKAKKGLKVHLCHCGRSYTRAEHLRRHQKNHAEEGDALPCGFANCDKVFFRRDLLHRHQERHNEMENGSHRANYSPESSPEASPEPAALLPATTSFTSTPLPATTTHASSPYVQTAIPFSLFRTPQIPPTPRISSSSFTSHLSPTSTPK
ncbi:hypothetical protein ACEQ8H_003263 [Pleosporales sp. CAS-2024a]